MVAQGRLVRLRLFVLEKTAERENNAVRPRSLARGFHSEGVVEPIEIVEKTRDGADFDDLALIEIPAELCKQLITYIFRIHTELVGKRERGPLTRSEAREIASLERSQLRITRAEPPCQGGVGVQSVFAMVNVRDAHRDHFFQTPIDRTRAHDGAKVRVHGLHDLRAMSDCTEHVRDVPSLFEE